MSSSNAYTEQRDGLLQAGTLLEDAYWELVITDITRAADLFAPLYESSGGSDGFVSVEVFGRGGRPGCSRSGYRHRPYRPIRLPPRRLIWAKVIAALRHKFGGYDVKKRNDVPERV